MTIQDTTACTVNGVISRGATCASTVSSVQTQLTLAEVLDILEARPERPDPQHPGLVLPAHPSGVFESAEDYASDSSELQQACRDLGTRCSYAAKQAIERRQNTLIK